MNPHAVAAKRCRISVGARVILACRDMAKGEQAARDIMGEVRGAKVVARQLDLADTKSICHFAENIYNSGSQAHTHTHTHTHTHSVHFSWGLWCWWHMLFCSWEGSPLPGQQRRRGHVPVWNNGGRVRDAVWSQSPGYEIETARKDASFRGRLSLCLADWIMWAM